ncbi:FAD-dependent pyridine nucleotide-disulfide oxidoreductase [Leptodontidium sp. 2 PMI_412]|nr:FAD-dependent pyridine nucleotide-disulfide oxidoreductase [Leptodontidium sp. 2 PMI_412]
MLRRKHELFQQSIRDFSKFFSTNEQSSHSQSSPRMSTPKKIVIVGGVAGGMSAATRARRLDEHCSITVFERGPYISYANCGIPYALGGVIKSDSSLVLQTPQALKERFNIDVRANTKVLSINRTDRTVEVQPVGSESVETIPYDKLILAMGAEPFRPPIDGIESPNIFMLQTIPDLQKIRDFRSQHNCKHVAIIGGGFIGLEVADSLRELGLEVSIIEYASHVFPPLDADMAEPLHTEIKRNDVKLFLNARIQSIEAPKDGMSSCIKLADSQSVLSDLVLVMVGIRARTKIAEEAGLKVGKTGLSVNNYLQTSDHNIYAVGDMIETENRIAGHPLQLALAGPANRQGRLAADNIFGRKIAYRGNVGTSACKVFNLTVASVGLSVTALKQMGFDPLWITVHPPDHAGYYPDSHAMTLKLAFEKKTGRILGAQAIGISGVDKRIDVLATAMQAGMTVFDLEHLELAYAPPYGSAKDPVNMAGFVASNILRGDAEIVHPEDLKNEPADVQILDVRSLDEFSRGHLEKALNIPLNDLRANLAALDKGKRIVVYCGVGYRGYVAYRILKQMGYEIVNLDGGYKSVVQGGFNQVQK